MRMCIGHPRMGKTNKMMKKIEQLKKEGKKVKILRDEDKNNCKGLDPWGY